MRAGGLKLLAAALLFSGAAWAQETIRNDENLASTRPEAWAMNYVVASTYMTAFGQVPELRPWQWLVAGELGHVPRLSESDQRVGFEGTKQEDLNRSPVFGRVRAHLGLPGGFVAELGYTPPVTIQDVKVRDLFALAIGRRVYERDGLTVSLRGFAQHGRAIGDITCPARLAGNPDLNANPYGCRAASDDQATLNYYGGDATASWNEQAWHIHATLGVVRTDLAVQVDALSFDVRDRSTLTAEATKAYLAVGASRDLTRCWNVGAELLYVPLRVQRDPAGGTSNDPFTGLRLRASFRFG